MRDPSVEIIDAQVHIWTENTPDHPWDRPWDEEAERDFRAGSSRTGGAALDAEALLSEMATAGASGAVLVPPGFQGDRNDYALDCVRRYPGTFGVMGRIDLRAPKPDAIIQREIEQPGMLGYRLTFITQELRALLINGGADWFWPIADTLGIPITLIAPGLLSHIEAIAKRHPSLRISLDHLNLTSATQYNDIEMLLGHTCALAHLPNVAVKATAVPSFAIDPYPFESMHGHMRRVVEAFGAERVFWGTDFSRLTPTCSYRQAVTLFTECLDFLSPRDLEWIMGQGVKKWYGWQSSSSATDPE